MTDITSKSIGMLLDELITTSLKLHHFHNEPSSDSALLERLRGRRQLLAAAIEERAAAAQAPAGEITTSRYTAPGSGIGRLITELTETLINCWQAQEQVMSSNDPQVVVPAAKAAQQLNANRNRLLREIDQALGEASITVTEKTYR